MELNEIWIPAIAALLGSLIPTVANLLLTVWAPKIQNNVELFKIRRELGGDLLIDF